MVCFFCKDTLWRGLGKYLELNKGKVKVKG